MEADAATRPRKATASTCNRKGVRFGQIMFRLYDPSISDNPSVSSGPPIGIGWTYYQFNEEALQRASMTLDTKSNKRTARKLQFSTVIRKKPSDGSKSRYRSSWMSASSVLSSCDSSTSSEEVECKIRSELVTSVDDYEERRKPRSCPVAALSPEERESRLRAMGYTQAEIAQAVREVRKTKFKRNQTYHNITMLHFEETVERVARSLRRVFVSKTKKQMMRSSHLYNEWRQMAGSIHPSDTAKNFLMKA